MIDKTLKVIL